MIGIDIPIERLRSLFESSLWTDKNNSFNGRCFRNVRNGNLIPEIKTSNNDYKEVLLQDSNDSTVFFDVENDRTAAGKSEANVNVNIYFSINLNKIYPGIDRNEATETAYKDVIELINTSGFSFESLTTGIDSFETWGYDQADFDNMHPYHLFRINTTITYNLNCL